MKFTQGDIFEVHNNNEKKFFFQYLTDDDRCLMGNVIQVFDYEMSINETVDISELLKSRIKFNTHIYIKRGIAEKLFKKIGNLSLPRNFEMPWFKNYEAIDFVPEVKTGWTVWQVNGKEKYLGKVELPNEYKELPFAGVKPPETILEWYETGENPYKRIIS